VTTFFYNYNVITLTKKKEMGQKEQKELFSNENN